MVQARMMVGKKVTVSAVEAEFVAQDGRGRHHEITTMMTADMRETSSRFI